MDRHISERIAALRDRRVYRPRYFWFPDRTTGQPVICREYVWRIAERRAAYAQPRHRRFYATAADFIAAVVGR